MIPAGYQGRTLDLSLLQGVRADGAPHPIAPGLVPTGSDQGLVCAGVQKLVQRAIVALLTASRPLEPTAGVPFLTELRSGRLRTASDVSSAFARSANAVERQLVADESTSDPDDERLSTLELASIDLSVPGAIALTITVTSRAGTSGVALVPIPLAG